MKFRQREWNLIMNNRLIYYFGGPGTAPSEGEPGASEAEISSNEAMSPEDQADIAQDMLSMLYKPKREEHLRKADEMIGRNDPQVQELGKKWKSAIELETQDANDLEDQINYIKDPDELISQNLTKLDSIFSEYLDTPTSNKEANKAENKPEAKTISPNELPIRPGSVATAGPAHEVEGPKITEQEPASVETDNYSKVDKVPGEIKTRVDKIVQDATESGDYPVPGTDYIVRISSNDDQGGKRFGVYEKKS